MVEKADLSIQHLSELKEIYSTQNGGDPSELQELISRVKQFKENLIKELDITNRTQPEEKLGESIKDIHKNQKYKNLSGSVDEIISKLYKK